MGGGHPEFETALALNRNSVQALHYLALCKLDAGSREEVIPLEEQAIRLSPRDSSIGWWYWVIGTVHLLQSRTDEAIVWLEKARRAVPAATLVHNRLASAYALRGETEHAAAELGEARRLSTDDRFSSIARLRAAGYLGVSKIRPLFEANYFAERHQRSSELLQSGLVQLDSKQGRRRVLVSAVRGVLLLKTALGRSGLYGRDTASRRRLIPGYSPLRRFVTIRFTIVSAAGLGRETATYMSSLMGPRAPVVEVPEARHHVMLDQPLGFVAAPAHAARQTQRVCGGKRLNRVITYLTQRRKIDGFNQDFGRSGTK
jgi:hypothetical protein